MALFTFATDDAAEASRIMDALLGPKLGKAHPKSAAEGMKAPKTTAIVGNNFTDASAPVANDPAPERPAPPADTVVVTQHAPSVSAAPVVPEPAAPVAVAPPPAPVAVPPALPPVPAPVVEPAGQAAEGWTLQHVIAQAVAYVQSPKGDQDKLKAIFAKYGITRARDCAPQNWHLLYADMAAVLEAA
jgi:hypothetical protein